MCECVTGSGSSGSNCSDAQKAGGRGSQSQRTKQEQEVGASPDKQPEPPSPPASFPGLHGNTDSKEDLPAGRQSFRLAVGNPGDFFVDVM